MDSHDINSFRDLKEVLDDYISHVEEINEQRVRLAKRELEMAMKDCRLFAFLQMSINKIYNLNQATVDALSENQQSF